MKYTVDRQRFLDNSKYARKRFNANSLETALEIAKEKTGFTPARKQQNFTIGEVFKLTRADVIKGQKPSTTADFDYWVGRFMKWLVAKQPDCQQWHLLTCEIIEQYLDDYTGQSKGHPLRPIKQAVRFMSRRHRCSNIIEGLKVNSKLQNKPAEVYIEDVVALCGFLKEKHPGLEAGVALQGLAGLQLQEVTRLTWDKVDLEEGLVEISGEVKNEYRNRVIPVCDRVIEALGRIRGSSRRPGKVLEASEYVILSPKGCSFANNWLNYSKLVVKALKEWNPRIDWKPKDLRNCLPTFATIHGLQNDLWEMYIGHAPRSVTARHYVPRLNSVTDGERNALGRQMGIFCLQVTEPLNQAISGESEAKILNFFERDNQRPPAKVQNA